MPHIASTLADSFGCFIANAGFRKENHTNTRESASESSRSCVRSNTTYASFCAFGGGIGRVIAYPLLNNYPNQVLKSSSPYL